MIHVAKVNQSWDDDQLDTLQEQFENDKTPPGEVFNVTGVLQDTEPKKPKQLEILTCSNNNFDSPAKRMVTESSLLSPTKHSRHLSMQHTST